MNKKQSKFNNHFPNFQKGLTLIEMLVAVAMFAITVVAVSGLFISSIRSQQRMLASQELSDQTSYVLEYITRALRMAKRATDDSCIPAGKNYDQTTFGTYGIKFIDHEGNCTDFYLDTTAGGGQIKKVSSGSTNSLTSFYLTVKHFDINIIDLNGVQPRVTIFLEIQGRGAYGSQPEIKIQATISQRNLNI
jgi:prepilin-type N-terminal cleavage/methylation domain-containing protein